MTLDGKKILLFANTDWYLYNFRIDLARRLKAAGASIVLASPEGEYSERLRTEFKWHHVDLGSGSKGILKNLRAIRAVRKLYKEVKPDLVHHFTIKCVLFGGIAARRLGIPAVHAVTGLGHVFTEHSFVNRVGRRVLLPLYRYVFSSKASQVIFQNESNRSFFVERRLVKRSATHLIRGSGANCNHFQPSTKARRSGPVRILFASRLIREKGIYELLDAVRLVRSDIGEIELIVAGDIYQGNPSSLNDTELSELRAQSTFLGHVDDMKTVFEDADIVVLPSYAEGTPRVLLDAAACGKPLIATDIAGCQGVVEQGVNGILVPVGDVESLRTAVRKLAENETLRQQFGKASRSIVESKFSESIVNQKTIEVYEYLLSVPVRQNL